MSVRSKGRAAACMDKHGWVRRALRDSPPALLLTITNSLLYIVNVRKRHPKPEVEVEEASVCAERSGWTVRDTAAGHKWGDMRCPEASREGCLESIWSTPRNPGNHAKRLKARVRNCPHTGDRHD